MRNVLKKIPVRKAVREKGKSFCVIAAVFFTTMLFVMVFTTLFFVMDAADEMMRRTSPMLADAVINVTDGEYVRQGDCGEGWEGNVAANVMPDTEITGSSAHNLRYTACTGMKRAPMATTLRIHCAERTRSMQLVCMCISSACTLFFIERLCLERHEVQVWQGRVCT